LLLNLTSRHLRLSALKSRLLCASAKTGNLLASLHAASKILRHNALLLLGSAETRLIGLLINRSQRLTHAKLLLPTKNVALHLVPATAERTATNSLSLLLGKLLTLLLLKSGLRGG
jgi:hypothetical protein